MVKFAARRTKPTNAERYSSVFLSAWRLQAGLGLILIANKYLSWCLVGPGVLLEKTGVQLSPSWSLLVPVGLPVNTVLLHHH